MAAALKSLDFGQQLKEMEKKSAYIWNASINTKRNTHDENFQQQQYIRIHKIHVDARKRKRENELKCRKLFRCVRICVKQNACEKCLCFVWPAAVCMRSIWTKWKMKKVPPLQWHWLTRFFLCFESHHKLANYTNVPHFWRQIIDFWMTITQWTKCCYCFACTAILSYDECSPLSVLVWREKFFGRKMNFGWLKTFPVNTHTHTLAQTNKFLCERKNPHSFGRRSNFPRHFNRSTDTHHKSFRFEFF